MFSNILLGAAGFPVADLGDTVQQSLRFNRNQWLASPAVTLSTYTASIWLKLGRIRNPSVSGGVTQIIIGTAGTGGHGVGFSNNKLYSTHTGDESTQEFRDPSGWYHLVINSTGNLYINGVEIATGGGLHDPNSEEIVLGHIWPQNSQNSTYAFEGLLANYHFIDGQELTPTSFGRTNEDGVWVPKNYTGTYGTNGARLIFDSSAGIGNDTSGNNNDYSIGGTFNTADVNAYQTQLTSTGSFPVNKALAFDGDTSTRCFGDGNATWTFAPDPAIAFDSLRIFSVGGSTTTFNWDGNSTVANTSSGAYRALNTGGSGGSISTSKPLTIVGSGGGRPELNALEVTVGGTATIITSSTDNDVDFLDTPTNNYAVLNPLNVFDASVTYSKANLRANYGTSGNSLVFVDMAMANGKYYWECTLKDQVEAWVGVITEDYEKRDINVFSDNSDSWAYDMSGSTDNQKNHNGSNSSSHGATVVDDTIGFLLDIPSGTLKIEINGATQSNSEFTNIPTNKRLFVAFNIGGASGNVNMDWNFGQMPFLFEPTGYQHVATNNLPEPTIKKGNQHFGVLTYAAPGSPSYPITINGSGGNNGDGELDFDGQPDLVWIKMTNGTQNHILFDTVRGATNSLRPEDNISEVTNRSNFAFATNGFTISAADGETYQQNDSYVAWCWKAGGTAVSNTDGTITSSVSANTDAGFSIVSYTGTGANATIGHGLTEIPELVIYKRRNSSNGWVVYSTELAATEYLQLHNDSAKQTGSSTMFNSLRPTNSLLNVGTNTSTNASGGSATYVAYCWHSVEGFSKFGSYTGNASGSSPDADGPFVYLGFRPAFLMIKRSDSNFGGEWSMHDTTRSPNNPNRLVIAADLQTEEKTQGGIDFLSNGFKIRDGAGWTNQSGGNYVYMAFAENPFGGENAAPATAR